MNKFKKNLENAMQLDNLLKNNFLDKIIANTNIDALTLFKCGQEALSRNDAQAAYKCEMLNKMINNCIIPSTCQIGKETRFVYGGQSLIFNKKTVIGDYCTISPQIVFTSEIILSDFVYMAPGIKATGAKTLIGSFCIIEANAVITDDIEPCSVAGGNPAKILRKITSRNFDDMARKFFFPQHFKNADFLKTTREKFMELQY